MFMALLYLLLDLTSSIQQAMKKKCVEEIFSGVLQYVKQEKKNI